jgi:hypothetical protein
MLLQQGASVEDEIVVYNPKPEAAKPAPPSPSPKEKKEKPVLKWRPLQQVTKKEEEKEKKKITQSVFQVL